MHRVPVIWPALYLDTETADFSTAAAPALPVQIAAILATEDRVLATVAALIRREWEGDKRIPITQRVIAIHSITPDLCDDYGWPADLLLNRLRVMLDSAQVVVGHNISFDIGVVDHAVATQHLPRFEWPPQFCTMIESSPICRMDSVGKFNIAGFKPPKLVEAYRFFARKEMTGAHDALADAYGCRYVHKQILRHRAKPIVPS